MISPLSDGRYKQKKKSNTGCGRASSGMSGPLHWLGISRNQVKERERRQRLSKWCGVEGECKIFSLSFLRALSLSLSFVVCLFQRTVTSGDFFLCGHSPFFSSSASVNAVAFSSSFHLCPFILNVIKHLLSPSNTHTHTHTCSNTGT